MLHRSGATLFTGKASDTLDDAKRLWELLQGMSSCRVNLIPFNPHPLSNFQRPSEQRVLAFQRYLLQPPRGLRVFVRRTRGDEVDAACGMLGAQALQQKRQQQLPSVSFRPQTFISQQGGSSTSVRQ